MHIIEGKDNVFYTNFMKQTVPDSEYLQKISSHLRMID